MPACSHLDTHSDRLARSRRCLLAARPADRYSGYVYVPMPAAAHRPDTRSVISSSALTPGGLTGRAAETAAIRRAISQSRLVTVTGLPGVGKTAAAIAAFAGAGGTQFPDGAWLIRLDALQDETLLPHTIAVTMKLPDSFAVSPLEALTEEL